MLAGVLFLVSVAEVANANVVRADPSPGADSCLNTLADQNIDRKTFVTAVGHGIHSLYLEPLRYWNLVQQTVPWVGATAV